ncbi:hypothetical protein BSU04_17690 [Caballeronia sordidicola]|uniref:Uncharacterized protein n=1 Tax=Caballeronia sordidicola TaxID=196367 RepID=A0A226X3B8_CABSO|nr:hypothetical protein BSU04_17690 [Caballeronia sordidicola]
MRNRGHPGAPKFYRRLYRAGRTGLFACVTGIVPNRRKTRGRSKKRFTRASSCSVCAEPVMTGSALPRPARKRLRISRERPPKSGSSVCIYRQLAERNPAFSRSP